MAHELINPEGMAPATGFAHVVRPGPGQLVFLAGQTAEAPDGTLRGQTFTEQFRAALENVRHALAAVGGKPADVVWIQIFTTDMEAYRNMTREVGHTYREAFGRHYPAMSMFEVSGLVAPDAVVELVCMAVVPASD